MEDGKIHHLRTILSQRHWECVNYERVQPTNPKLLRTPTLRPTNRADQLNSELAAKALAEVKAYGEALMTDFTNAQRSTQGERPNT